MTDLLRLNNLAGSMRARVDSFWHLCAFSEAMLDLYEITRRPDLLHYADDMLYYLIFNNKNHGEIHRGSLLNAYNDDVAWFSMACLRISKYSNALDYLGWAKVGFDEITNRSSIKRNLIEWSAEKPYTYCCVSMYTYAIIAARLGHLDKAIGVFEEANKLFIHGNTLYDRIEDKYHCPDEATYNYGVYYLACAQLGRKPIIQCDIDKMKHLYEKKEMWEYNLNHAPIFLIRGMHALHLDGWQKLLDIKITNKNAFTDLLQYYIDTLAAQQRLIIGNQNKQEGIANGETATGSNKDQSVSS